VYLYRYSAAPYTQGIKFFIAGQPIAVAPERAYTWVHVKAGTYNIEAQWPSPWPSTSRTLEFVPETSYYLRVNGVVGFVPGGLLSGSKMTMSSSLTQVAQNVGEAELIACCKLIKPEAERLP
jgi:hypothetical protein